MMGRILLLLCLVVGSYTVGAQQQVPKSNNKKVYMHYMPWFETPETIGRWGWHWTMNNRNPNNINELGRRDIASHYYPLIGPYASRDKDVIEYHLLLMKLSGIDGVLINWYGIQGSNGDINDLLLSSNAIISLVDDFGLEFGVVMEDRFSRSIEDAKANVRYLKENYFTNPAYIRYGAEADPLVAIFGPITFQEPAQWTEILAEAGEDVEFLTLWYESGDVGAAADGEYSWVYQDSRNHINHLESFYNSRASQLGTVMGSAYPGFEDFYQEGGAGSGYFYIPHNRGGTLEQTLAKLKQYANKIDLVQLVTWNDFGEGTIFEPTLEFGFDYLEQVQDYTGVAYTEQELKLVYKLYLLRKKYPAAEVQQKLDLASQHLANLEFEEAASILNEIDPVTGLLDNGQGKAEKLPFRIYPNPQTGSTLLVEFTEGVNDSSRLSLFDVSGRQLFSHEYPKGTSSLLISTVALQNGVYLLELQCNKKIGMQKVVISR